MTRQRNIARTAAKNPSDIAFLYKGQNDSPDAVTTLESQGFHQDGPDSAAKSLFGEDFGCSAHLQGDDEKGSEAAIQRSMTRSDLSAATTQLARKDPSIQKRWQIGDRLSHRMNRLSLKAKDYTDLIEPANSSAAIESRLDSSLGHESDLALTTSNIERYVADVIDEVVVRAKGSVSLEDKIAELKGLQSEREAGCRRLSNHLEEACLGKNNNVSTIDNYATGDAIQIMVSTTGQVLHGSNRGFGSRTRQVGGYLSENVMLQLSRDLSQDGRHNT